MVAAILPCQHTTEAGISLACHGSMTMFMSTGVVKWHGYGGKACNTSEELHHAYCQECLQAWKLFQLLPGSDQ